MELPKAKKGKRALLVEGGGMKGAFAGGVLHSLNCILPAKNFDLVLAEARDNVFRRQGRAR